jgi:formate-dependent nitrite reductase membrane component NrfD
MKTRLTGVSFGLALAAAIFLLVWPIYTGSNGKQTSHATSLQVNGPYILIPVMFPVLTTLIALLLRKQAVRIVATILLGGFAVIAGFTIGLFYLPAGIPMLPASCVADSAKLRDVFP